LGGKTCCRLGEQVIAGPDRHVREPGGDVLVPQHVQQGEVGMAVRRAAPSPGSIVFVLAASVRVALPPAATRRRK
jgi:hypothetical protein